ncbi:cobalamin biosynthesis protein, partial [Candidatus Bathyarchaeota archaeon]|nr:cobalamin biosynthesis protein [Candidatus Bathyarchaeota archaeon]
IDPSKKSFDHIKRAYRVAKEVKIEFKNFHVVGGFRFPERLENQARKITQLEYLGKIAYDEKVEEYVLSGKSLLGLPSDSPAYISVKKIMEEARYAKW